MASSSLVSSLKRWFFGAVALLGFAASQQLEAQTVYSSDSSSVSFFSHTPLEDIKAVNHASTAMIEMMSQVVKIQVPVAAFQFENHLMQEHFNEGYLEPQKFQYATFRGKLSDSLDLSIDTVYMVQATGMLSLHGLDRAHTFVGKIVCQDSIAQLTSGFELVLADHEVKVPGAVFDNIAKLVKVDVYFRMHPFRKEE
ncbi:MAG: YceI family protein [Flavobacteriales bacterium]|nr:YceI family protein [Flavobacteriales bacterium]